MLYENEMSVTAEFWFGAARMSGFIPNLNLF